MYTLIIKGDETATFAACRLHKVEITSIVKHALFDECIVTTPATADEAALNAWFCAAIVPKLDTGFAPGTLLWWGPRAEVPADNIRPDGRTTNTPVAYPPVPGWDFAGGPTDAQ